MPWMDRSSHSRPFMGDGRHPASLLKKVKGERKKHLRTCELAKMETCNVDYGSRMKDYMQKLSTHYNKI